MPLNADWLRIGRKCQCLTNPFEMDRIGNFGLEPQKKANPKPIPDNQANAAKSGCQFPANLAQLNLTAHRQALASKF